MRSPFQLLAFPLLVLLLSPQAGARVFNFSDQTVSTYLRGTFGTTKLQSNGFAPGVSPSVSYPGFSGVTNDYSGEFGFGFTAAKNCTFRAGVELLSQAGITGQKGTDSSGTVLFSMDEQLYSVIPQISLEIFMKQGQDSRFYFGGGVGYAITTVKNTFTMTSAGQSALGLQNYIEEGSGWGIAGKAFAGYEFAFFDNVSLSLDLGYRYLAVDNYTANRDFTSGAGATYTGNQIKNVDGTNRYTDLSGFFAALTFRFYFR